MQTDGSKQAEFLRHTALAPGAVHWRLWGRAPQFPSHCLAWVSCLFCFARFDLYNLFSAQASFRSYLRWHLSCICILKTHHPGLFFPCCLGLMSGENTLCLVSSAHGSHPGNWFVSHPGRGLHSCFVFGLQSGMVLDLGNHFFTCTYRACCAWGTKSPALITAGCT